MVGSTAIAASPSGLEPLTTLCVERCLLSSELSHAPADSPRLQRFKNGVALLNRIAHAEVAGMPGELKGTADFLDEPILAIELDAILDHFLKRLDPKSLPFLVLQTVQQSARRRIFQTWMTHKKNHSAPFTAACAADPRLTDPTKVQEQALTILKDFEAANHCAMEDSLVLRIASLGETQGLQALETSLFLLLGILCSQESIKQNVRWLEINQANPRGMRRYEFRTCP